MVTSYNIRVMNTVCFETKKMCHIFTYHRKVTESDFSNRFEFYVSMVSGRSLLPSSSVASPRFRFPVQLPAEEASKGYGRKDFLNEMS